MTQVAGKTIRVLLLEDDPADAQLCLRWLKASDFSATVDVARTPEQFKDLASNQVYDIVLTDYRLPGWTGLEAFRWVQASGYHMPFILVTGTLGDDLAVECIKQGINDYVLKENLERLPTALTRALDEHAVRLDRDRVERELRQTIEQYRSIVEGAPYGIARTEKSGRVLMVNPALVAMLGYEDADELLEINAVDLYVDLADREQLFRKLNAQPSSTRTRAEVRLRRKDGKQIIVQLTGRHLPSENSGREVYEFFIEDVTQQRVLEQEFLQAQKMEAVGRLAGGVAHDFNNLLMIISGYTDLMQYHKDHPEKIGGYVVQIQNAARMAASVVRQLLAFSRKEVPERRVLDLNSILADLRKMLPRLLGEDVELTITPQDGLKPVNADRGNIEQIIMNLAVNARDAMPHGGKLMIRTSGVEVDEKFAQEHAMNLLPGGYVTLAISDTGVGMEREIQNHIFEPFFTTKEQGKGTGLGLATVYGIVKQNEGFITVDSAPGKGTTFTIYFPAATAAEEDIQRPQIVAPASAGHETVLLAEDEPSLREIVHEYLESKGYKVLEAGSGEAALSLCKTHRDPIHLLISDVIMPGMRGQELAKAVRELYPESAILLISGYTDRPIAWEEFGTRVAYIQKPVSLGDLGQKIRVLLDTATG